MQNTCDQTSNLDTLTCDQEHTPLQTKVERTAAGRYAYTDIYIYNK